MSFPSPGVLFDVVHPRRVWLITAAHGVNEFYSVALPPILPLLVADLDITYGQAGGLLTVYFAMYSIFQLPAGVVADRVGQRRLLAGGMVAMAVGLALASAAPDYRTLLAAQVVAGIGGSTYHPSGMSLISDLETGATEGRAMGIHGLGGVVGTALAPALIGGMAVLFDWRFALAGGAFVGLAYAGVFSLLFSDPDRADEPTPEADGGEKSVDDGHATGAPRLGAVVNVPLRGWVVVLFVLGFLLNVEIGAVRTFAATYLFARVGESATIANSVFFVMLVGGGISSIGFGLLADRVERRTLGAVVMAVSGVALAATWFVPSSPVVLAVWFFALGIILYAVFPALNALTSAYSEREFSASLFGVMQTASALGGAIGPLLFGLVAENAGLAAAFPLVGVVGLLGAVAFLSLFWC